MPSIKINQIDLYYEIQGEGFPLVLINDLAENIDTWQVISNNIAQYFKLILFDYRHFNTHENLVSESITIKRIVTDVIALLNHLNIPITHVLGAGMGGFVAQELAIRYPARIAKLILQSTATSLSFRNKKLLESFVLLTKLNIKREIWIRQFLYWQYSQNYYQNIEFIEALINFKKNDPNFISPLLFEKQVEACSAFDSGDRLKEIQAESLIILGEEDILFHPQEADILYQGIIHASYPLFVQNCGHAVHVEHPKQFIHAILGFLYKYIR